MVSQLTIITGLINSELSLSNNDEMLVLMGNNSKFNKKATA